MEERKKLLQALIEKESRYSIDVIDGSMLPEKMKSLKKVDFVIKPPTLDTIARAGIPLLNLPDELLTQEVVKLQDVTPHVREMVQVISTISWARKDPYPDWYEDFLLSNCGPMDIFKLFTEAALKMQTDFFLNSFLIASQNPMMWKKQKSDDDNVETTANSTRTSL